LRGEGQSGGLLIAAPQAALRADDLGLPIDLHDERRRQIGMIDTDMRGGDPAGFVRKMRLSDVSPNVSLALIGSSGRDPTRPLLRGQLSCVARPRSS
jgi:hypothetical protein